MQKPLVSSFAVLVASWLYCLVAGLLCAGFGPGCSGSSRDRAPDTGGPRDMASHPDVGRVDVPISPDVPSDVPGGDSQPADVAVPVVDVADADATAPGPDVLLDQDASADAAPPSDGSEERDAVEVTGPDLGPTCDCTSGPCCDGCRYRPAGTTCGPVAESRYGCAFGVRCGSDVSVRHAYRTCTGASPECDGPLGPPQEPEVAEDCLAPSGCVAGTCTPTATCEGALCPAAECPRIDDVAGVCNQETGHCEYDFSTLTGVWVLLRPGTYEMGQAENELPLRGLALRPRRTVTLTRPFLLRQTELTKREWVVLMGNRPFWNDGPENNSPADSLSWWDAVAWCNALSRSEGLEECYAERNCVGVPGEHPPRPDPCPAEPPWCWHPGNYRCEPPEQLKLDCTGYRLPTEAEWEYACRAGSPTELPTGGVWDGDECDVPEITDYAWVMTNSRYPAYEEHPDACGPICEHEHYSPCGPRGVAEKLPNPWGLYDMMGNVWEHMSGPAGYYFTMELTDPVWPERLDTHEGYANPGWGALPGELGHLAPAGGSSFEWRPGDARCTLRGFGAAYLWNNTGSFGGFRPARTVP